MYLLDTNVWLERLLDRERADEVGRFLQETPAEAWRLTDFSLHSVGVILSRQQRPEAFRQFVTDLFAEGAVDIVRLCPAGLVEVAEAQVQLRLDFDDAYQYIAVETHGLTLVSFDSDFERAEHGRVTPAQALRERDSSSHENDDTAPR
ncbi:VapC toxin family PIN domain ribonuclease [Candidatus Poribacteria bacterium]|nr:VapC toxin family PIN domain ribonuclease [Candidatus Poribacteria bacterium]